MFYIIHICNRPYIVIVTALRNTLEAYIHDSVTIK